MAGPWEEDVVVALLDKLDTVTQTSASSVPRYWHTPRIERVDRIGPWLLNEEHPELFAIAPVEIEVAESGSEQVDETLVIEFQLSARHKENDIPYEAEDPRRWTRQNRLFHDFKTKILEDVNLGGLTTNINFRRVILVAEDVYLPGWANVVGQIAPYHSVDKLGRV